MAQVKAELHKDDGISGLALSVETHRGEAALSRFVGSKRLVRCIAEMVSGVPCIKNSPYF